jgi:chromosome segregation ATPase
MHNHNLQKEIRNLHKVLVKELGEGYSVEKLLKNDSSIKGRTEQISILKDKIKQLNQKLKQSSFKNMEEVIPKPQSRTKTGPDHNGLHRLELDKRKEYEKVQSELNELNQKLAEMKIKSDGLIARNRILEDTKKETKAQITALLKKADDDDQFIAALREEVSKYKVIDM